MSRIKILFGLLVISSCIYAQPTFNLEEIRKKYPDHDAVYLNYQHILKVDYSGDKPNITEEISYDILYLNDKIAAGRKEKIGYVKDFFEVEEIEACTWDYEGGKAKKIKVKEFVNATFGSGDVFYDDYQATEFYFPSVKMGSVGSLKYTYRIKRPEFLHPLYLMKPLPVINGVYKIQYSGNTVVKHKLFGINEGISFSESKDKRYTTCTWTVSDLKPFVHYSDEPSYKNYVPHVVPVIDKYTSKGKDVTVLHDLNDLYRFKYSFISNINSNEPSDEMVTVIDSLKRLYTDKHELAKHIYYWVQDHVKYIAFEDGLGGFVPRDANQVFRNKYGDCKDYSSLIYTMMRKAGIDAHLTWIGTRDLPYRYSEWAFPGVSNHMIAAVRENNNWIFLDGTGSDIRYGFPSGFIQGKEALISISPDSFALVKVEETSPGRNLIINKVNVTIEGNTLKGNGEYMMDGIPKFKMAATIKNIAAKQRSEFLERIMKLGNNKCIIRNTELNPYEDKDKDIRIKYDLELQDYIVSSGEEYYVNLNLEKSYSKMTIDTAKRVADKEFDEMFTAIEVTTLAIPSTYQVTFVPEDLSIKSGTYTYEKVYTLNDKKDVITLTSTIRINKLLLDKKDIEEWNRNLLSVGKAFKSSVVLKKK